MDKIKVAEDIVLQANYFLSKWDKIDRDVRKSLNKDRILLTKEVMLEWLERNKGLNMTPSITKTNNTQNNKIKFVLKKKEIEEVDNPVTEEVKTIVEETVEVKEEPIVTVEETETTVVKEEGKRGIIDKLKNLFKRKDNK